MQVIRTRRSKFRSSREELPLAIDANQTLKKWPPDGPYRHQEFVAIKKGSYEQQIRLLIFYDPKEGVASSRI